MKANKLGDSLNYFYIKRIKQWIECPVCHEKMLFSKEQKSWICAKCAYTITEEEFLDDYVFWFCDGCSSYLNSQRGFDRKGTTWTCSECGFHNDITHANVKGMCKDCGTLLDNPNASVCPECKTIRLEKAIVILEAVSDFCHTLSDALEPEETGSNEFNQEWGYFSDGAISCANCGNTNQSSLWDENDTVYCSVCHHRTSKLTGEDDVVECPYCHRMRDRKAMYCRHCNDSAWEPSTPEEFAEIDCILKEMGH